jgi:hypothetical protein
MLAAGRPPHRSSPARGDDATPPVPRSTERPETAPGVIPTQRDRPPAGTTRTDLPLPGAEPARRAAARQLVAREVAARQVAALEAARAARTAAPLAPGAGHVASSVVPATAGAALVPPVEEAPATGAADPVAPTTAAPAPSGPRRPGGARAAAVAALCLALVGVVVVVVLHQLRADAEAAALVRAQERVAALEAADRDDEAFLARAAARQDAARYERVVRAAVADAQQVVAAARAAADAAPHGGDAELAALRAAATAAERAAGAAGAGVSPVSLAAATAAVAEPQRAVLEAQAAWQAAEDARVAAERAAAEQAAAEQAAAEDRRAAGRVPRPAEPVRPGAAAAAPAATAWAPGVQPYATGGLGAAVNAARAENGMPALAVQGSTSLANHAATMAAAGTIWHSGDDHIVGWVQPVSDSEMIRAYLNSPGHRAWILKDGRTTVSIGAVTVDGRLYTAMRFS